MSQFVQFVLAGLTVGSTYALAALGYTLVFSASGMINLAQGEFIMLGAISVTLNTLADVVVVLMASATRTQLIGRPHLMRRLTQGSGVFIAGLGLSPALARRPANG